MSETFTESDLISIRQSFLHIRSVSLSGLDKYSPIYNRVLNAKRVLASLDEILNSDREFI